ncbi:hypothetical protein SESBI_14248 [Sesbania bispinosa]|nr:hypothetical protein SESBI_14248 [Sesbania bispinosa]
MQVHGCFLALAAIPIVTLAIQIPVKGSMQTELGLDEERVRAFHVKFNLLILGLEVVELSFLEVEVVELSFFLSIVLVGVVLEDALELTLVWFLEESGTTSKLMIKDTGERLKDFAQSLNLPFSFNIVMVSDMLHLREDLFEIDPEETVTVYSQFALRSKIQQSDQLESLMRVIRTISLVVMVVAEPEANHNSTYFVNHFIEALFYFSAFFDCLEAFMEWDEHNRMDIESLFVLGIRNMMGAEKAKRKSRSVNVDVEGIFLALWNGGDRIEHDIFIPSGSCG